MHSIEEEDPAIPKLSADRSRSEKEMERNTLIRRVTQVVVYLAFPFELSKPPKRHRSQGYNFRSRDLKQDFILSESLVPY